GGWTTPLDLFGYEHQTMYVVRNHRAGSRVIEGVKCVGVGATGNLSLPWAKNEKYRHALVQKLFRMALTKQFKHFVADFVLCLDPEAGYAAMESGLPYAMRFHSPAGDEVNTPQFARLLENAIFNIAGPTTFIPGVEEIPHNQDLSRFNYVESPSAERAILLTSINQFREPDLFIEGVMLSKSIRGDIVGTGEDRKRIASICKKTGGRVRCLPPVPRLKVPALLNNYQIGVATVKKVPIHYQMKVNGYMASGLFTVTKPWTHIAVEAPHLVRSFTTAEELAEQLNYLSENWLETLEIRRNAREWVSRNYSVEIPRK
ncbi:MAG: glycosyltransferase family 4 protein, partial [bacterium]|nr:glycosyltransferase family 4 protein [bacterium]